MAKDYLVKIERTVKIQKDKLMEMLGAIQSRIVPMMRAIKCVY